MLGSNQRRSSDAASSFVDEGDDLHITPSFQAHEENSSVTGNVSLPPSLMPNLKEVNSGSFHDEDDSSTDDSGVSSDGGEDDNNGPDFPHRTKKPQKETKKVKQLLQSFSMKKGVKKAQQVLPWKIPTFLNRGPRTSRATREYQEVLEEDGSHSSVESDVASYTGTVHSMRSTRVDIATGRSMLVRQNAQVMGRASAAQTDWDIGSVVSSSGSSISESSSKRVGRSISWSNNSTSSGRSLISHLTGDSLSMRSKRSDFTVSKAMYIHHPGPPNLLCSTAEEEDNFDDGDELNPFSNIAPSKVVFESTASTKDALAEGGQTPSNTPLTSEALNSINIDTFGNNFRPKLQRKIDVISQISGLSFASDPVNRIDKEQNVHGQRQRIHSDSDYIFEIHRKRTWGDDDNHKDPEESHIWFLDGREQSKSHESETIRPRSYSESYMESAEEYTGRPRCHSASMVDENAGLCEPFSVRYHLDGFDFTKEVYPALKRSANALKPISTALGSSYSKLQTLAPTFRRNTRQQNEPTDTEPLLGIAVGHRSTASRARRHSLQGQSSESSVLHISPLEEPQTRVRSSSDPESMIYNLDSDENEESRQETQLRVLKILSRISSTATTATEAGKRIASAMRPTVTSSKLSSQSSTLHSFPLEEPRTHVRSSSDPGSLIYNLDSDENEELKRENQLRVLNILSRISSTATTATEAGKRIASAIRPTVTSSIPLNFPSSMQRYRNHRNLDDELEGVSNLALPDEQLRAESSESETAFVDKPFQKRITASQMKKSIHLKLKKDYSSESEASFVDKPFQQQKKSVRSNDLIPEQLETGQSSDSETAFVNQPFHVGKCSTKQLQPDARRLVLLRESTAIPVAATKKTGSVRLFPSPATIGMIQHPKIDWFEHRAEARDDHSFDEEQMMGEDASNLAMPDEQLRILPSGEWKEEASTMSTPSLAMGRTTTEAGGSNLPPGGEVWPPYSGSKVTPSTLAYEYYWKQQSDGEESCSEEENDVLWPLVADDSFESMF